MACRICLKCIDRGETVSLTEKGANGVNNATTLRNADIHVDAGDVVHKKCRQTFINKKDIATNRSFDNVPKRKLQRETTFDNKSDCFLCATTVLNDKNHRQEFYTENKGNFRNNEKIL